jgi:hypothetical protein
MGKMTRDRLAAMAGHGLPAYERERHEPGVAWTTDPAGNRSRPPRPATHPK